MRPQFIPLALMVLALAQSASEPIVQKVRLPGAGIELGGILVRPDDAGSKPARPAIIILHGYQPPGTNAAALLEPMATRFATMGYIALALSMRGWPPTGGVDDCGLHQPDDVVAALDWLAKQPGVDPDRIAIIGLSQGGQVALLTAARSTRVRAIVALYPVTDIDRWKRTTTFPGIAPYITRNCEPGGTAPRSPLTQAAKISAPVLLIHGGADMRVPTEQSTLMRDALQKAGKDVQLVIVPAAVHGFRISDDPTSRAAFANFLTKTLGAPPSAQ